MFLLKPHFVVLALTALLSACGGGGGSSSTTPATPTSFADIVVPSSFTWATTQTASQDVVVTVTRSGSAAKGEVKVLISNFSTVDPTGNPITTTAPIRAGEIATMVLGLTVDANGNGSSANAQPSWTTLSANFGKLTLPATTTKVLVEVFDTTHPEKQAVSAVVAVKDLASGVALTL